MTNQANNGIDKLIALRRWLHQHPEIAGEEGNTAGKILEQFADMPGFSVTDGLGGSGIIATIDSGREGKHTMVRCELDALPIHETGSVSYKSVNDGNAHLCGHDGHMAIVIGLAKRLQENPPAKGKVSMLFQPAEETGQGAQRIIDDPAFEQLKPDQFIALHNIPGQKKGLVLVRDGPMCAASTGVKIHAVGQTSHAARPEEGQSPWIFLQTMANKALQLPASVIPLESNAKVTLVGLHIGGERFGTSPAEGTLWLTLRAYSTETLEIMLEILKNDTSSYSKAEQLEATFSLHEHFDAVFNDERLIDVLEETCAETGHEVELLDNPYSWSEDFGRFTAIAPVLLFGLGAGVDTAPLHASDYDFPDEIISDGIAILEAFIRKEHDT